MSAQVPAGASYRGLTWDHPRGFDALHAAAARAPGLIAWAKQPLAGFETAPIGDLCAQFDVVVMDHPHLGEALKLGCLRPLDDLFGADTLADIRDRTVGRCFASYAMEARQWALPLDAATQVMALRPDLAEPVALWSDIVALAERGGKVALSLQGPHGWLTFLSIYTALGGTLRPGGAIGRDTGRAAFGVMRAIVRHQPSGAERLNPIAMLDAMRDGDDIALCPLIFGYVPYTRTTPTLAFHDAPRRAPEDPPGSVIGGTGICISARCDPSPDLLAHLAWLLGQEAQNGHLPDNAGQPSARQAWRSASVNAACGNFYRNTLVTMEAGIVRPRFDGYIAFQSAAAEILREALAAGADAGATMAGLNGLFSAALRDAAALSW